MLHKLSLDANGMAICWQVLEWIYTNIFPFCEQILPECRTRDIDLANSVAAHEIKMLCVKQGFPSKPLA